MLNSSHNGYLQGIQIILFDLDGTLRFRMPPSTQTFYDYAVQLGIDDGPERRWRAARWTHYYWAQSPELIGDVRTYGELNDAFWLNFSVRALLAFDCSVETAQRLAPEVTRYMREEHKAEDFVPPETPQTLQMLREAGYRLGVLSNRDTPFLEELDALGLLSFFEMALAAGEVNSWKPDPQIFCHALERMGAAAEKTLYVGDNYYADILGAQQAGLRSVLLDQDGLFPEAECPVICGMRDLQELLLAQ